MERADANERVQFKIFVAVEKILTQEIPFATAAQCSAQHLPLLEKKKNFKTSFGL